MQLPGVPWSSSGALHAGNNLTNAAYTANDGQGSYMSQSMGPGLYGDENGRQEPNGHHFYEGTEAEMTLDMVTEVDENDFDEDVSGPIESCLCAGYLLMIVYLSLSFSSPLRNSAKPS